MNIGVFDSGIGGLSVLKSLLTQMPEYNYVYLGDNLHLPYGQKSPDELYTLTCQAIDFLADKQNCRLIILACNTASTVLRRIQQEYLPIYHPQTKVLGVIRPAAEAMVECKTQPIGIMATEATTKSGSFILELAKLKSHITVYQEACPLLVPLIESGQLDSRELKNAVSQYVHNLKAKGVKIILLGCTHYELIADLIEKTAHMKVIREGELTAEKLLDYLKRHPEVKKDLFKNKKRIYIFTKETNITSQ